ncbi:hypothetical protein MKX78_24155 [Cytobacillus sp. FSL R5-0569]|nr:hypothetical protein [Cytobacillus kochii]MDQ0186742.1 hypothetical protein [Cytobacillus kochii]
MKKIIISSLLAILLCISSFSAITNARNTQTMEFPPSAKVNNQLFGYFMLDLYHKEILSHVQRYYKDKNVQGYGMPENDQSVFIRTTRNLDEDLENQFSYLLKVTLLPSYQNGTVVGKDTLYFAVEPSVLNTTKVPDGTNKIKLIKYEHEEVQKK